MGRKVRLSVSADLPQGMRREQFRLYVQQAVLGWCKSLEPPNAYEGQDSPGDPLFYVDPDFNVKVT
jgi:hypothetical protein